MVAVHIDESGADAKAGLAWTFVFAGDRKIGANGHEPLSERARATIQAEVNRLYAELCGLVAANRGLISEAMRGTDAAIPPTSADGIEKYLSSGMIRGVDPFTQRI